MLSELFINGTWQMPSTPGTIAVFNPCTEEILHRVAAGGPVDVDKAVAAHQRKVEWQRPADATKSVEREQALTAALNHNINAEAMLKAFMVPPVYQTNCGRGYGTFYTAMYYPATASAELIWPGTRWPQSCAVFTEGSDTICFDETAEGGHAPPLKRVHIPKGAL